MDPHRGGPLRKGDIVKATIPILGVSVPEGVIVSIGRRKAKVAWNSGKTTGIDPAYLRRL
jgi:hypothetical protein